MLVIQASLPQLLNEMTNVYLRVFMRLICIGGNMYKETSVYKVLITIDCPILLCYLAQIKTDQSLMSLEILRRWLPSLFYFWWPFKKFCPGHKMLILNSPFYYLVISFIILKRIWCLKLQMEREILLANIRNGTIKELSNMFLYEFLECICDLILSRRCASMSIFFIKFHNHSNKLYFLFLIKSGWFI